MWLMQLQLIKAGQKAAAKNVGRFVKQIEQDVATVSALPVVVPSSNGRFISYRFDPTLHALANPASAKSKAGNMLKATSIPALVVIVCHEDDLKKFDTLRLYSATRWIPKGRGPAPLSLVGKLTDTERILHRSHAEPKLKAIQGLDQVKREMDFFMNGIEDSYDAETRFRILSGNDGLFASLRSRVNDLTQKAGTSYLDVPLPDQDRSHLSVSPSELDAAELETRDEIVFAVRGDDVQPSEEMEGYLGGHKLDPKFQASHSDVMLFQWDAQQHPLKPGSYDFVVLSSGETRIAPEAVTIKSDNPKSLEQRLREYQMARDAEVGSSGTGSVGGSDAHIFFQPSRTIVLSEDNATANVDVYRIGNNGTIEPRVVLRDSSNKELGTGALAKVAPHVEVKWVASGMQFGARTPDVRKWEHGDQDVKKLEITRKAAVNTEEGEHETVDYTLELKIVGEYPAARVDSGRSKITIRLPHVESGS